MRTAFRVVTLSLASLTLGSGLVAQASRSSADVPQVRDDRFKWFFGAEAGAFFFQTQNQTQSGIPTVGAHIAVVSRRGGVMLGVSEGFGSNEPSSFLDPTTGNLPRSVTFDRIRRYGFNLAGYPVRGMLEPYLGIGFGFLQVQHPEFDDPFTSPEQAALSAQEAHDRTTTAFMSGLAGVQFRLGRLAAFGQYQINSAPAPGNLIRGTGHSLQAGLRFSLGNAREDPQDDAAATYAPRITKDDSSIDWSRPARELHNQVRGLHPWPHAQSYLDGKRLIVLRSSVISEPTDAPPGSIVAAKGDDLAVATGSGALRILTLQTPRAMTWQSPRGLVRCGS